MIVLKEVHTAFTRETKRMHGQKKEDAQKTHNQTQSHHKQTELYNIINSHLPF